MKQIVKVMNMRLMKKMPNTVVLEFVPYQPETEQVNPPGMDKLTKGIANMPGLTEESREGLKEYMVGIFGMMPPLGSPSGVDLLPHNVGRVEFPADEVKKDGITIGSLISIDVNAVTEQQAEERKEKA